MDMNLTLTRVAATGVIEQSVCDAGASEMCVNWLTMPKAANRIGVGANKMCLKVRCTEDFVGTGTVISFKLESDTDAGFATALKQHMIVGPIPKARAVAGVLLVNQAVPACEVQKYLGLRCVGDNTFETTGKIIAWFEEECEQDAGIDIA